jgi:DNA polymerase-1
MNGEACTLKFMKKPHLVLLDANHLMHRAYWALPRTLKTKSGELTNAVYGVMSMLLKLLVIEKPDAIVACFDAGKETFRHDDHTEYKAGRQETPQDFYDQIPRVEEGLRAFSIPIVSLERYEADDLIATYAREAEEEGFRVTIVSGDRDVLQLASQQVRIAIPHKGYEDAEYMGTREVKEKYGVEPTHIPDYKGLVGDTSDNLPGVPGIGPKRGKELLEKYGTLENVYSHIEEVPPSVRGKLEEGKKSAFKTKELATLVANLPLPERLQHEPFRADARHVREFFESLQFHTLAKRFESFAREDPYGKEHVVAVPGGKDGGKRAARQLALFGGSDDG